jgi:hypothetical protein
MKALIVSLAFVALSSQAAPPAPGQARDKTRPPTTGTSSISGTVTADESGSAPVRRAIVRVSGATFNDPSNPAVNRIVVTDDKGRYVVPNLPAGRFYLSVEKGGWVTLRYGAQSIFETGVAVAVADGQGAVADMKLTRGAVIAGRVVDEHGRPQAGMRPALLEYRTVSGQQRLMRASMIISQVLSQTNDLGEYRLFGIRPGTYVVAIQPSPVAAPPGTTLRMATDEEIAWARQGGAATPALAAGAGAAPPPGQGVVFSPVYYPGVTDASSAATITVGAGEQRTGVDFVTALVPTTQVRGVVVRPDGQPAAGVRLAIGRARGAASPLETASATVTADSRGAFTFPSVATGDFVISARGSSQAGSPSAAGPGAKPAAPVMDLWGSTPLTVSGRDVSGITVTLQPGMTVSGRVIFEATGGTTPPAPTAVRLMIMSTSMMEAGSSSQSVGTSMMSGSTNADGTFSFQGLAPGRFVVSASGPGIGTGTWMQKALIVAGRNVLDSGLELRAGEDVGDAALVLNDQPAEISGTLLDTAGRPAPEYHVFVFPADKAAWTQGSQRMRPPVRPASDGRFRTMSLLSGEYYVAALSRFDPANLYDAAFLEQVAAQAFKITLAEGEKKVQDLRIK